MNGAEVSLHIWPLVLGLCWQAPSGAARGRSGWSFEPAHDEDLFPVGGNKSSLYCVSCSVCGARTNSTLDACRADVIHRGVPVYQRVSPFRDCRWWPLGCLVWTCRHLPAT